MENRIREIREQFNLTQRELAKAVGITRPYLSNIERGIKVPGGDIVIKIAVFLKMPVEEIFFVNSVNHGEPKDQPA